MRLTSGPREDSMQTDRILEVQDVAKITGLSGGWIRQQADLGFLRCERTPRGTRLFRETDVSAFMARRQQQREPAAR
jgi:predicted DNA-binding transcriptional regulator AlpA